MTVTEQSAHELYRSAFAARPELDAAERTQLRRIVVGCDLLTLLAGGWLLCAPLVLGYGTAERGTVGFWNTAATGAAIALAAGVRAARPFAGLWLRAVGLALGAWLVLAPAVVGAGTAFWATLTEVAVGLLVSLLAGAGLRAAVLARRLGSGTGRAT
jgi:hypothetical protein